MKKLFNWALVLIFALTPFSALAQEVYQDISDGILTFAGNGKTVQEWLDETVSPAAGSTMDYYVLLLNRFGTDLDYTEYVRYAAPLLEKDGISNPVTRQKCALAVNACGAADMIPGGIADETIGKLGVMSYVYGLHLLNNGAESEQWTIEAVIEKLLEMQKADGGWAVMGQYGDTDVTAMCIQALACNRGNNIRIIEAINEALNFLSQSQLENGGFI
ncbi:MAG: terpene cyclase/mutase family protein, partial [Clostridia bacterium]|nr:terpene cyclase/mutase family protein [Clostridia bacterium]